jgi:predicted DNA-binding protein
MIEAGSIDGKDGPVRRGRGRPATGHDPSCSFRLPKPLIETTRQEAVRRGVTHSVVVREAVERFVVSLEKAEAA